MNKSPSIFLAASLLLFTATARSSDMPYADASSPSEAVGMMTMTIEISSLLRKECSERFPEQMHKIDEDMARWRKLDEKEIAAAEKAFREMVRKDPSITQQLSNMKLVVMDKLFKRIEGVDPDAQRKVQRDYCQQYFSELSSGVWRERTPKKYYYLRQYK